MSTLCDTCNLPIEGRSTLCDTCNLPIEGRIITALGKSYHPDHFVCGVCNQPITESPFHERDGKPLCSKDYEASCPTCAGCNKPIVDNVVNALGKKWHEGHFTCEFCQNPLVSEQFYERDGKAICNDCYKDRLAAKCQGCGDPIVTNATVALNAKWHPECFKCTKCTKPIEGKTFKVDSKGNPVCGNC